MKIVVNDIAASIGGALSILEDFYDYVKENDFDNQWVFLLSEKLVEETPRIKVVTFPWVKKSHVKKIWFDFVAGKRYVKKIGPDVVLSMQNIITFGVKTPQVLYIHQAIPFQEARKFSFFKSNERNLAVYQYLIGAVIKLSARKADKVIVQTQWMRQAVIKKCRVCPNKITNILPSVKKNMQDRDIGLRTNAFFYPTADVTYKNNQCVFNACKILNNVGINEFEVKLTLDATTGVSNNVLMIGKISRSEIFQLYGCSVLLFPSYIESCALPLVEARTLGAVIFCADTPFSHEILDGYENAFFFEPFNPKQLAALMKDSIEGKIVKKKTTELDQNYSSSRMIVEELQAMR